MAEARSHRGGSEHSRHGGSTCGLWVQGPPGAGTVCGGAARGLARGYRGAALSLDSTLLIFKAGVKSRLPGAAGRLGRWCCNLRSCLAAVHTLSEPVFVLSRV